MHLLLALVIAQTGTWADTFVPEATASHLPAHCEQLVIGPSTGWHGEARAAFTEMQSLRAMHVPTSFAATKVRAGCDTGHFDAKPDDLALADAYVRLPQSLLTLVMLDVAIGYAF